MNNYKLFLDDERIPGDVTWIRIPSILNDPWIIVRDYGSFIEYIKKEGMPSFISFDHDLAHEHYRASMYNPDKHYSNYYTDGTFKEKTGYECAKWLIDYCIENDLQFPEYSVHSMNPIGRENIIGLIESYKKSKL